MRRLLAPLLLTSLLLAAFGTAVASGGDAHARHQELVAARQAALDSYHENRTRILDNYSAAMHAIKDSFLENKTKLLADCHAARNATTGYAYGYDDDDHEGSAESQCVHDGMRNLTSQARAGIAQVRENAHAELIAARAAALGQFANAKAAANAKYGKPSS